MIEKTEFLSHQRAGDINKNLILNYIKNNAPITRTEIWERLGLSRASVTQITRKLIEQGLIDVAGPVESSSGRKPILLKFNVNARTILVFDWHSKTLASLNMDAEIKQKKSIIVSQSIEAEEFVDLLKNEIDIFMNENRVNKKDVLGLGLILPGIINSEKGKILLMSENNWKDVLLGSMFKSRTSFNTIIEMDSNVNAIGEYLYGHAKGVNDFVLFEVEKSGIGLSLFLNGVLYKGKNNFVGEIGHIKMIENGPLCKCGKKGCLEAVIRESISGNKGQINDEIIGCLGWVVSVVINILDPEMIVFSGSIIETDGNRLLMQIKKILMDEVIEKGRDVKFTCSTPGDQCRMRGMGSLVYNRLFSKISTVSEQKNNS